MSDNKAELNLKSRIDELSNVNRIVNNALTIIGEGTIQGKHAPFATEVLGWLNGFSQTMQTQIKQLEAVLPKEEAKEPVKTVEIVG